MTLRRLVVLAGLAVAGVLVPAVAEAKVVKPDAKLVAVAPGTESRVTYDVNSILRGLDADLRFVRQPALDTVVLEGPTRMMGRHRRLVRTRPCARVRLHVAIVLGPVDPFELGRAAVPDADMAAYRLDSRSDEVLGMTSKPPGVWLDRRHDAPWKVGGTTTSYSLVDWSRGGVSGFETVTAVGTILRLGNKSCRSGSFLAVPPDLTAPMLPGKPSP